jgi:hypothetical protein
MMIKITKILGMTLVGLFLIGLALEAGGKIIIGLLMVAFWGLVLIGIWEICLRLLFGEKNGGSKK